MFAPNTCFLVVDDSAGVRSLIQAHLIKLGFTSVFEAENGKDALERMHHLKGAGTPVQVIISDWNMPEMNGLEFLTSVRNNPAFGALPFLMVTGQNDLRMVINAIGSGVSDYVVKPFTEETLLQKLESVWKKHSKGEGPAK